MTLLPYFRGKKFLKMSPAVPFMRLLMRYIPMITLPFAGVFGFFGYHIESLISDRYTPASAPIKEQREERFLENLDSSGSKKGKHNPLEVNLSPSLSS